ncbi:hypothetical protein Ancab_039155, partial [Ancistrocladus abbreviatus]
MKLSLFEFEIVSFICRKDDAILDFLVIIPSQAPGGVSMIRENLTKDGDESSVKDIGARVLSRGERERDQDEGPGGPRVGRYAFMTTAE